MDHRLTHFPAWYAGLNYRTPSAYLMLRRVLTQALKCWVVETCRFGVRVTDGWSYLAEHVFSRPFHGLCFCALGIPALKCWALSLVRCADWFNYFLCNAIHVVDASLPDQSAQTPALTCGVSCCRVVRRKVAQQKTARHTYMPGVITRGTECYGGCYNLQPSE